MVLLVVYDCPPPAVYAAFQDCDERPFAWSWLMQPPAGEAVSLSWSAASASDRSEVGRLPPGLDILRFHLRRDPVLERVCGGRRWLWSRHV